MRWVKYLAGDRIGFQLRTLLSRTVTALKSFILAMTLYPGIQRKAQARVDRVIGDARLPVYSDEDSLPYLQAVLKEVLRWYPVTHLVSSRHRCNDHIECVICPS
jgi:cytochrome P450